MRKWLPALILLLATPSLLWAGPYEMFGTGPRAIGMGGAYAALGSDIAGLYYNIAGITQVERMHVEFGYVYAQPHLTINGEFHDVDQNRGTTFGVVVSTTIMGHRISTGVNTFIPDDHVLRFLVLPVHHPHFTLVANSNHTVVALVGMGIEIFDWMSIGIGSNVLGDNKGGVDFTLYESRPSRGSLASEIGSYFSPMAGLLFKPFDWWQIGLSYREKVEMQLDLPNTIDIPPIMGFDNNGIPIIRESRLILLAYTWSHFSPRQFELGTAFKPHQRVTVSADMTFMQWSEMQTDAPISIVYLSGGLADIFPAQNGPPPPAPNARDTWNPAVGAEYTALDHNNVQIDLRGGYRYRPTPIPEQTGLANYLDSNCHYISGGLGSTFRNFSEIIPRPLSLDFFVQYQLHEERIFHKTDPTDSIGDFRIEGHWWNVGGSMTLRF